MRAGHLRDRVTLQKHTQTQDARGEVLTTWADSSAFWAHVVPLRGSESEADKERTNEQFFKVRYRPRKDIQQADRFQWQGYTLEIITIPMDPTGRGNEQFVECRVIV